QKLIWTLRFNGLRVKTDSDYTRVFAPVNDPDIGNYLQIGTIQKFDGYPIFVEGHCGRSLGENLHYKMLVLVHGKEVIEGQEKAGTIGEKLLEKWETKDGKSKVETNAI